MKRSKQWIKKRQNITLYEKNVELWKIHLYVKKIIIKEKIAINKANLQSFEKFINKQVLKGEKTICKMTKSRQAKTKDLSIANKDDNIVGENILMCYLIQTFHGDLTTALEKGNREFMR